MLSGEGERRETRRQRSLLGARFVSEHPSLTIGCTIRDLTESGALIVFPPLVAVPSRGWLVDPRTGVAYDTVAAWHAGARRGVKFLGQLDVTKPQAGWLNHLHRLWLVGPR